MKKRGPKWIEKGNKNTNSGSQNAPVIIEEKDIDNKREELKVELKKLTDILVDQPRKATVLLEHKMTSLSEVMHRVIDNRNQVTKSLNSRILVQGEEAKIMTQREMQLLQQKIKLEDAMEKETLKRFADLKASIAKIKAFATTNEKNIDALLKKRKGENVKNDKMVSALMVKETQSNLKRKRSEATLHSLEVLLKEKSLQKVFMQKQLNKLDSNTLVGIPE